MSHLLPSTVAALNTKTVQTLKTTTVKTINSAKTLSSSPTAGTIFATFASKHQEQQLFNDPPGAKPKKLRRKRENPQAAAATPEVSISFILTK